MKINFPISQTYALFDWTGIAPAGQFQQILTGGGLVWDTAGLYTTGEVTLIDAPGYPPGDFDDDGDVDLNDLQAWQDGFGISSGATLAEGDADLDGDVDGNGFLAWQTGFGTGPGSTAATTTVPEPATPVLLLLRMGIGISCRGRWSLVSFRRGRKCKSLKKCRSESIPSTLGDDLCCRRIRTNHRLCFTGSMFHHR